MSLLRSRRLRSARRLGARGTVLLDPLAPPRLGADTLFCLVASHYLEYYGRVPPSLAYAHPEIVSFSTPSMRIRYGPKAARKEFTYEFSPPMHAGEARKRLEEMHAQAKVKLGIVRRPSPSLRLAPASGRLTLAHVQSDAVVSGLPLSVPAIVGTLGLTYLAFLLATARPERVASWVPWQARAFAPLVKLAGLDPDAPANAGARHPGLLARDALLVAPRRGVCVPRAVLSSVQRRECASAVRMGASDVSFASALEPGRKGLSLDFTFPAASAELALPCATY